VVPAIDGSGCRVFGVIARASTVLRSVTASRNLGERLGGPFMCCHRGGLDLLVGKTPLDRGE